MMTQDEQRIAIAEWCGWTLEDTGNGKCWHKDGIQAEEAPPVYQQDLNACHEAEKNLSPEQTSRYENLLALQVFKEDKDEYWVNGIKHINAYCFHATASQRCEALCRTLWPERWV